MMARSSEKGKQGGYCTKITSNLTSPARQKRRISCVFVRFFEALNDHFWHEIARILSCFLNMRAMELRAGNRAYYGTVTEIVLDATLSTP
jgi:hypothetical protein